MNTTFLGIGHYSRTGKDTFANALVAMLRALKPQLMVARKGFATKLKDVTHQLYGWAGLQDEDYYNDPKHEHERNVNLPALGMTPVEIWVCFGTHAVRNKVYDATWLNYVLKTGHPADVLIIPDCRFPNEVEAVKAAGGVLIKIVRPGYGPRKTVADQALVGYGGWDYVLGDGGTIAALHESARQFAAWLAGVGPKPVQTAAARKKALAVEVPQPVPMFDPPEPGNLFPPAT